MTSRYYKGIQYRDEPKDNSKTCWTQEICKHKKYNLLRKEDTQNYFDVVIKKDMDGITPYKYLL